MLRFLVLCAGVLLALPAPARAGEAGPPAGGPPQTAPSDTTWLESRMRLSLAVYPLGATLLKQDGAHIGRLAEDGWTPLREPERQIRGMFAALRVSEGAYGAELVLGMEQGDRTERYQGPITTLLFRQRHYTGMVLLNSDVPPFRFGVGAGLRQAKMHVAMNECDCYSAQDKELISPGLAADMTISLPSSTRLFSEVRVQARYFKRRNTEYVSSFYLFTERLETGGFELMVAAGGGVRVLR